MSAAIQDRGGGTALFFDFSQIRTRKKLNTVTLHERRHVESGALHGVRSPYEIVARMEYKANRYVTQLGILFKNLRGAVRVGMRVDELADYFDVTEDAGRWAITYCTERRGIPITDEAASGALFHEGHIRIPVCPPGSDLNMHSIFPFRTL